MPGRRRLILGHMINGTQAEYVCVPFADNSTYLAPAGVSDGRFVTHRFDLDDFIEAYDVLGRAADTGALKVVLSR